jgi:hypothetical protein
MWCTEGVTAKKHITRLKNIYFASFQLAFILQVRNTEISFGTEFLPEKLRNLRRLMFLSLAHQQIPHR